MPKMRATVIIPNWNGSWLLSHSLLAPVSQSYREFDSVVVDNGSTDGSVPWIKSPFPDVRVIAQDHSIGFPEACNHSI